jgi:hypothetical protein
LPDWGPRIGAFATDHYTRVVQLQAADFVAYEYSKEFRSQDEGRKPRWPWNRITEMCPSNPREWFTFLNRPRLAALADNLLAHGLAL